MIDLVEECILSVYSALKVFSVFRDDILFVSGNELIDMGILCTWFNHNYQTYILTVGST